MALTSVFWKILGALNLTATDVLRRVEEIKTEFPETDVAADEFQKWFEGLVTEHLTPESAAALAMQTWQELTSEHPGYGPHHGAGV
ncbi:MAG: hypothetical protein A2W26_02845 [Acidobacteria bacterium RBG_16_64_8]|nr:MAG: hypothetical protein A2W26_02845 [Acidobacteria bacterium RBG_16_64_8]